MGMESNYKFLDEMRKEQEVTRSERNRKAFAMSREEFNALEEWFRAKYFIHHPAFDQRFDAQNALARDTARRVWLDMEREWKKQHENQL